MMRLATAFLIACSAALAVAAHAATPVPLAKNQALAEARAKLMQAGWKPDRMNYHATDEASTEFARAGYTETEQCSGIEPFCVLDYNDGHGACLRVIFDYGTLKPLKAWVTSWTHECANPAKLVKPGH